MSIRWALARKNAIFNLVVAPKSAIPGWIKELNVDAQTAFDLTTPEGRDLFMIWISRRSEVFTPGFAVINSQQLFIPSGRNRVTCRECSGSGFLDDSVGDMQDVMDLPIDITCPYCKGRGTVAGKPAPTELALFNWDVVIIDESTGIRNVQSQTYKIAMACFSDVKYRCVLSGEYAPEGPEDIFGQMCWAFGSFMGKTNYYAWIAENFDKVGYDLIPKPGMLQQIKAEVHRLSFVLSRKAAGIGEVKCLDERWCELPKKIKKVYDHAERWWEIPANAVSYTDAERIGMPRGNVPIGDVVHTDNKYSRVTYRDTKYAPVAHNWLRQIAGGIPKNFPLLHSNHKLNLLWEVLEEYKYEPVVVSFKFNAEMFAAKAFLEKKGLIADAVWGDLPRPKRDLAVSMFQAGKRRVLLKQCAVHFGMDLSAASTMIRFSLPDRYEDLSQDQDRIVHPTKNMVTLPLLYIDLVCKDTVDEDVLAASRDKSIDARYFMHRIVENYRERLARKVAENGS